MMSNRKVSLLQLSPLLLKRASLAMIGCAFLLVFLNLYMNLINGYLLQSSLQLDLSPDKDAIGFHQFDLSANVHLAQRGIHPKDLHGFAKQSTCPGLCPPPLSSQTQTGYVKSLISARMRQMIVKSFRSNGITKMDRISHMLENKIVDYKTIWKTVANWTGSRQLTPPNLSLTDFFPIIDAISTAAILTSRVPKGGTQLKVLIELEGGQKALMKPGHYRRDEQMPTDTPFSGADRHNGEIAAFHLATLLKLNKVPVVVGRKVNVEKELMLVAEPVLKSTFIRRGSAVCLYGQCLYCRQEAAVCSNGDGMIETAIILWLPDRVNQLETTRSPWARTYDRTRPAEWQINADFCSKVLVHPFFGRSSVLLDLMDMAIFDFLIGNSDRHRLELVSKNAPPMLVLLDNGKSFGNAYSDEVSILAPLYQCCLIRVKMYNVLILYSESNLASVLDDRLRLDPLYPILTDLHLEAINRRVCKVLSVIYECIETHGRKNVFQDDGP